MIKWAKISSYQLKKIIHCFVVDVSADQASKLLQFNRNTTNRYYMIFRIAIALHQQNEFRKFVGLIELDESYFGARRVRGFHGKLKRGRGTLKQPVLSMMRYIGNTLKINKYVAR